ncbi:hypothetical protein WKT22_01963 [Candidatus Lokiarchaeum ossiferum]
MITFITTFENKRYMGDLDEKLDQYSQYENYAIISSKNNRLITDQNKVFIPFRAVYEIEMLVSLYLINYSYDSIEKGAFSMMDVNELSNLLGIAEKSLYRNIVERFFVSFEKIKPIRLNARDNSDRKRMGNVNAYSESRIPAFFAVDRLKVKFLILKKILTKLKENDFVLQKMTLLQIEPDTTLETVVFEEYYKYLTEYFNIITPKKEFSHSKHNVLYSIGTEKLEEIRGYLSLAKNSPLNYIMRSLKSSLFVCNLIFTQMDVPDPFYHTDETIIDIRETIADPQLIPSLVQELDVALRNKNITMAEELHDKFELLVKRILKALSNAINTASNGQIHLRVEETLYSTGSIFENEEKREKLNKK